jgi:hypothetical protein
MPFSNRRVGIAPTTAGHRWSGRIEKRSSRLPTTNDILPLTAELSSHLSPLTLTG